MGKRRCPTVRERDSPGHGVPRSVLFVAVLVALSAVMLGLVLARAGMNVQGPDVVGIAEGQLAPDFTITDVNGTAWNLAAHRGRVVLIDFMGVRCESCEQEMASNALQSVFNRHAAHGLAFLSIDIGGTLGTTSGLEAWRFMQGYPPGGTRQWDPADWPIALDLPRIQTTYQATAFPTKYLLDRTGHIVWKHEGIVTEADLGTRVQALLG